MTPGTLYTLGMGPGDPDLITVKAAKVLAAARVIAFFAKRGRVGHARESASPHIGAGARELRFEYPVTTEIPHDDPRYRAAIDGFYDRAAAAIGAVLAGGEDVALLCEGDPFFYGSAMYVFDRLGTAFRSVVIPGVTGMSGCWTRAGAPIAHGDDVLTILPGTLGVDELAARLGASDAAVIMKIGRNLEKVRVAIDRAGVADRALYVERGAMSGERIARLGEMVEATAPYFSMILVPGRQRVR